MSTDRVNVFMSTFIRTEIFTAQYKALISKFAKNIIIIIIIQRKMKTY